MNKENNPKILPLWNELFKTFKDRKHGTVITYAELSDCIGFDIKTKRNILEGFKREMLRQNFKALESVRDVGYRIVEANEHSRLSLKEIKRAERRSRKGVEYALCIDFDSLNDIEKRQITDIATRVQRVHSTLVGEFASIKNINVSFKLPSLPRH